MSLLVFQFVIKQWDRSQCSPAHESARADLPTRSPITAKPSYYVLELPCIVDQHGDDTATNVFSSGRIRYGMSANGSIRIDRFQLSQHENNLALEYHSKSTTPRFIGNLNAGWIQCQYRWRYSVVDKGNVENKDSGMRYWMYEEITLNAARLTEFDADYFLSTEPQAVFCDNPKE